MKDAQMIAMSENLMLESATHLAHLVRTKQVSAQELIAAAFDQIERQNPQLNAVISERRAGHSKYTLAKMLSLALDGITSFSVKPIYCILWLGVAFILISLAIGIYVIHAIMAGTAVPGWSSLILSVWFVGGMVLISIGVVGAYIGKIYKEVKRRPLYNIKEILGGEG